MKKQWFAYDPNDCPEFFKTEEEAAKRANEILAQYAEYAISDGWDELTDMICYGKVTHAAMKINEITKTGELDEEGIDEDGVYWESGMEFKCDYEIQELTSNSADRISDLERRNGELESALKDMLSGWKYIRETHGDLYGVGWDRAQNNAEAALTRTKEHSNG